jgi:hypothetical protein
MPDDQNVPAKWVDIFAMYKDELARAEAAEAEVGRLRAELATMPRPENRCHGEWPCEASTALAFAEAEAARSARFLGECGYLVGIEVYSPDDIPVIAERLGALHTRAEAAEARGAAAERTAVVAWLRANVAQRVLSLHDTIACIERGEHLREEEK